MRSRTAFALTLLSLPARADRIAALPPVVADAAPEIVDRLHDAVVRGLTEGGGDAVPAADVRSLLAARADLAGCRKGPCVAGVAEALGAARLAAPTVEITGKNYHMIIDLLGGTGEVLATSTASCDICTMAEAEAALQGAAADLTKRPAPTPPAAPAAPSPAPSPALPVAPPPAARARHAPAFVATKQEGGWKKTFHAHRYDLIALGALLAGTASIIAGGYLVALHGDCSDRDASGDCVQLHNTGAGGAALVGGGVVAYGGAAIAVWLGHRPSKRSVFVAPVSGGGLAAASVQF